MTILAAILFAATFQGCTITRMVYYPPLVIEACGNTQVSPKPGIAVYGPDGALTVPGPVIPDRVLADSFE